MPKTSAETEDAIMQRAIDITTPAEWIGFFEWFTFARLFKVTVLLVFGNSTFNVNGIFGEGFEPYVSTATYYVLAVKLENGKSMSAVNPGSLHVDVNHFEIAVPWGNTSAKEVFPVDLTQPLPPCVLVQRQSAGSAAREINLTRKETEAAGECGIDTMCFHRGLQRSPLSWQRLREELSKEMISNSTSPKWQDAFLACDELDLKRDMPKVSHPIPVGKMLSTFPTAKASVESLLGEGPRKEQSLAEQVSKISKATHAAEAGSTPSSSSKAKPLSLKNKKKAGASKSGVKSPGPSPKGPSKAVGGASELKSLATPSTAEPKVLGSAVDLGVAGASAAAAHSSEPVGMTNGETSKIGLELALGTDYGSASAPVTKGYASVSIYHGNLTKQPKEKDADGAMDSEASLVAASLGSDVAAKPCYDSAAAGALVDKASDAPLDKFAIVPDAVDDVEERFGAEVEAVFAKYGVQPASNVKKFAEWIGALPLDVRSSLASSMTRFEMTRQAWKVRATVPKPVKISTLQRICGRSKVPISEKRKNTAVRDRLVVGEKYTDWVSSRSIGGSYHTPPLFVYYVWIVLGDIT